MGRYVKRFLLNLNSGVLHDTHNETNQCQLREISRYETFDYKSTAKNQPAYRETCDYCLEKDG